MKNKYTHVSVKSKSRDVEVKNIMMVTSKWGRVRPVGIWSAVHQWALIMSRQDWEVVVYYRTVGGRIAMYCVFPSSIQKGSERCSSNMGLAVHISILSWKLWKPC